MPVSSKAIEAASTSRRRVWMRRFRRGAVLYVVVPYLFLAGMLGFFQRYLIYFPTRAATIRPEAGLLWDGQLHEISVETDDHLTLNGWHYLASGRTAHNREECDRQLAGGRWLVLYFPGNAGNRGSRVRDCQDFTQLDADVFLFDYRGYGDNPGSPSETAFAADAQAIWRYATEERHVPPERILIYGESLGGGVATRLTAELCESGTPPAGLVLSSTFSSFSDTAAWHYPWFPVRTLLVDRYPSFERMPRVTCPVTIIHGVRDDIVPIELARKLFAAVPHKSANGIEKQFVALPGAGHNDITKSMFAGTVADLLNAVDAQQKRPTSN